MYKKTKEIENNMNDFMNRPEIIPVTELNIIEEFNRYDDIKHVAKVFNITTDQVRAVLKQAGIKIRKARQSKQVDELRDVGMTERDFYVERD